MQQSVYYKNLCQLKDFHIYRAKTTAYFNHKGTEVEQSYQNPQQDLMFSKRKFHGEQRKK